MTVRAKEYKYGPAIDGLGLAPRGANAPPWVAQVVTRTNDKTGTQEKAIALGILEPGVLTKAQALELANWLASACHRHL